MHGASPRLRLIGLIACALSSAKSLRADPLPIDLTWDAPAECPSQADVMTELARITRVKPGRVVTSISAQAKIERTNDGRYKLVLRTQREDQTGDTDLEAATCPVLKRGVTLVLALALGDGVDLIDDKSASPAAAAEGDHPAPAPTTAPTKPAAVAQPNQAERDAAREPAPLRLSPWLAAAGASGLIGKPSLGARFGLTLGQADWQAMTHATFWPRETRAPVAGVESSFSAFIGAVAGCGRAPFGAWSLSACANFEVGAIRGSSRGAFQDGSATAPWYAAGPSLVLTAPISGPVKLRLEGGLSIAFDPPHFAIQSFRELYAVSRYVPGASLGIAFDPQR